MELFSDEWMKAFMEIWNATPAIVEKLAQIKFNSVICYGFKDEPSAKGVIVVENGQVIRAGSVESELQGAEINWDLRCSPSRWEKLLSKPMTMSKMAAAYMAGNIKFYTGDYSAMIGNPKMAGPFIDSFTGMGKVNNTHG